MLTDAAAAFAALDGHRRDVIAARAMWLNSARREQLPPDGDWTYWLALAGRGWGKTKTAMEDAAWYGATHPGERVHLIGATWADVRDTMIEGYSGLIKCLAPSCVDAYNRSLGEIVLRNGTRFKAFAATEPDRLRGPQCHRLYADEMAAWQYPETWDQALFGLRLGQHPKAVITTTPRPTPIIRKLVGDPATYVTRGSTFDNAANLAPSALAQLKSKYEGTRLGRQELSGEILEDTPGALWTRDMIDAARKPVELPQMARVVVAIDPSGARSADDEGADSIGIVVAGKGIDGRAYVLADRTCKLSPAGWGRRAVDAYREFRADRIVAERNFGGAMVAHVIRTTDPNVAYSEVVASRGKVVRAEPVAALYEQCIAAGSLISCERGLVPIEDVRPGDFVWTRVGLKRVLWAGQTGIASTMTISAGDQELRLTHNHPVLTTDGWVNAGKLAEKDREVFIWLGSARFVARRLAGKPGASCADLAPQRSDGKHGRPHAISSFLMACAISDKTMAIGVRRATAAMSFCTGLFGGSLMAAKSQTGGISTIWTRTHQTTSIGIWLRCLLRIMAGGIGHTAFSLARPALASNAGAYSLPGLDGISFVRMNAGERDTLAPSGSVEPVFNLHVEGQHEYVANGILVHNCRVSHIAQMPDLEDQMCQIAPDGYLGDGSPDRVDALVWALTELMLTMAGPLKTSALRI